MWLTAPSNMTEKQLASLEALQDLELETAKVWVFKESFRHFFDCETESDAQIFFDT